MNTPKHIVAASCLVSNPDNQILMIKGPRRGWEIPGGQIEEGESVLDAVKRETLEESGAIVEIDELVGVYSNLSSRIVVLAFLATYVTGTLTCSEESEEVVWIPRSEVLDRVTHPPHIDRIRDMLNFSGRVIYRSYVGEPYKVVHEQHV